MGSGCAANNRGVTILEVIVALTVLVAVSAVVLPAAFGARDRALVDACRARLETAVSTALELAAESSGVVEIRAAGDGALTLVRLRSGVGSDAGSDGVTPGGLVGRSGDGSQGSGAPALGTAAGAASDREPSSAGGGGETPSARRLAPFPEGVAVVRADAEAPEGVSGMPDPGALDGAGGAVSADPVALGWALPTGAFVAAAGWSVEIEGAGWDASVGAWSGAVTLERREVAEPGAAALADGGAS